jgi:hypothetical protein
MSGMNKKGKLTTSLAKDYSFSRTTPFHESSYLDRSAHVTGWFKAAARMLAFEMLDM